MDAELAALRRKLSTEMPVSQRLGIRVAGFNGAGVRLRAPLAANINHQGTAFAGSLNAVATLAGWATVWSLLRRRGCPARVVIQDSTIRYLRPVTSDFEAVCEAPPEELAAHLVEALSRRGRGRIAMDVTVCDDAGAAIAFTGRYVAMTGPGA